MRTLVHENIYLELNYCSPEEAIRSINMAKDILVKRGCDEQSIHLEVGSVYVEEFDEDQVQSIMTGSHILEEVGK